MIHYSCDLCGKPLLAESETRYVAKIEVYAAYDPMEVTQDDLEADHSAELEGLMDEMSGMSAQEIEEQIYKTFRFDLCESCRDRFMADPLGRARASRLPYRHN